MHSCTLPCACLNPVARIPWAPSTTQILKVTLIEWLLKLALLALHHVFTPYMYSIYDFQDLIWNAFCLVSYYFKKIEVDWRFQSFEFMSKISQCFCFKLFNYWHWILCHFWFILSKSKILQWNTSLHCVHTCEWKYS